MSGHYEYGVADESNDWQAPATWVEDIPADHIPTYGTGNIGTMVNDVMTYPSDPGLTDPTLSGLYKQNTDGTWVAANTNGTDTRLAGGTQTTPSASASFWDRYIGTDGKWNVAQLAKDGFSLAAAQWAYETAKNPPKTGYQGGIPTLTAERSQVAAQDRGVRPGAGGHQYFTQTGFADPKDATGLAALKANIAQQKTDIEAQNKVNDTPQLARQRIANLPNAITPDQFYGRVTNTGLTDEQKVKLPTATTTITPAGVFTPEVFTPTGTTGGKDQSKWTTEQVASFIRDQHLTSDRATIDKAAAAAGAPKWQVDAAIAMLGSGNLTGVNAASQAYQDATTGSPEEVRQGNINRDVLLSKGITPYTDTATKTAMSDAYNYLTGLASSGRGAEAQSVYNQKQAELGFTDRDMAQLLGKDLNTFKTWDAPAAQQAAAPVVQQQAAATAAPVLSNAPSVMDQVAAWTPPTQERQFSTTGGSMAGAQSYGLGQLQSILRDQAAQGFTPQQLIGAAGSGYGLNEADVRSIGQSIGLQGYAQGGLMGLAQGGSTNPRYLRGQTDGMADKIPARIDGQQEAALAHGEFVVPADVVSHLGNGNSDAGADVLYKMMDKIRKARTGTKKQGKQIDPNKFTPGGLAYAAGGQVLHFAGTTGSSVPAGTVGIEENLSNWAGPYVTNMLGKGQALANAPYQVYQGPLSAGDSALQTQGFQNAANLKTPTSIGTAANTAENVATNFNTLAHEGYPTSQAVNQFTVPGAYQGAQNTSAMFGAGEAQQYMNPYLQQALDPQLVEARRQSQITQQGNNAQATQAGAFGGARQGIVSAENQRNLANTLQGITGQGYNTAYNNAQQQFNTDQSRLQATQNANEQSRQFGANFGMTGAQQSAQYGQAAQAQNEASNQFGAGYGLQALQGQLSAAQTQGGLGATQNATGLANLSAMLNAGGTQQATQQAGIAADQAAFNAERDNPYKMVQYQQSLLQGLPISAQQYNISTNPYLAGAATLGETQKAAG